MSASNKLSAAQRIRGTRRVAARELGGIFDSPIAYVTTIAFTILANSIFMNEFFLTGNVDMTGYFDLLPLLLAIFLPAISMRVWAEERRQRTVELLLTLPIRTSQAVLGKYLASLGLFGLFLLGSLPIPIMLRVLGEPDWGAILSGYLGLVLFAGLFLAFGSLLSALSRDQIIAFVTTTLAGFGFVLSGDERVVAVLDGLFPALALGTLLYESLSVMPHYDDLVRGVIQASSLVYFLVLTSIFLWAASLTLDRNRS